MVLIGKLSRSSCRPFSRHTEPMRARLGGYIRWAVRASAFERRVMFGAALTAFVWVGLSIIWAYLLIAVWRGPVVFVLSWAFTVLVMSNGIALPLFVMISWPGLFRRYWAFTPTGIVEKWVNPDIQGQAPYNLPGYRRKLNGQVMIGEVIGFGPDVDGPIPTERQMMLYSTTDVHNATDMRRAEAHFKPLNKMPNLPVRVGALAAIIGMAMFMGLAIATDTGAAGVSTPLAP